MDLTSKVKEKIYILTEMFDLNEQVLLELYEESYDIDEFKSLFIMEASTKRATILTKIMNEADNILEHLVKILYFDDQINNPKHAREMSGILRHLQNKTTKKLKISKDHWYKLLFTNIVEDVDDVKEIILTLNPKYKNLSIKRSVEEVYAKLQLVYNIISEELANNKFTDLNTILKGELWK